MVPIYPHDMGEPCRCEDCLDREAAKPLLQQFFTAIALRKLKANIESEEVPE